MLSDVELRAYKEARREGLSPALALYAARPPVVTLDWLNHYQFSGEWANFTHDGFMYKVVSDDPAVIEGECQSCMELVKAWRAKDDGCAWITDDEYNQMDHRYLTVTMLNGAGEETTHEASLWGVCGLRRTPTEIRMDDRYVAETVLELADQARAEHESAEVRKRDAEAAKMKRRNDLIDCIANDAVGHASGDLTIGQFTGRLRDLFLSYRVEVK